MISVDRTLPDFRQKIRNFASCKSSKLGTVFFLQNAQWKSHNICTCKVVMRYLYTVIVPHTLIHQIATIFLKT
jgi:hypothetical protein